MIVLPAALLSAAACASERAAAMEIADAIAERYVIEEVAIRAAETIRSDTNSGVLDVECGDRHAFAEHMKLYLRELTGDGHFHVDFPGDEQGAGTGMGWVEQWRSEAPANAFGVQRVERLSDNIGYLALSSFYDYEAAKFALTSAFTLLSTSDAMILDLRNNGGGSSETAWPIEWTFRDAGSPITRRIECRVCVDEALSEADFDWPRYGRERPLVILVNDRSFSASEAVAYGLQAEGRATIIGESSGGGAHMLGEPIKLSGGWTVSIPEARPVNSLTHSNWEGEGVRPDIFASSEAAISVAIDYLATRSNLPD